MREQAVSTGASTPLPERVQDILRATCRVVVRDGAHGLRMATVAREAGVSKALLHYYFSTRQELLRAAFAFSGEQWSRAVERELEDVDTGAERVARYLTASVDRSGSGAEQRALWDEVWSSLRIDAELRPVVAQTYGAWIERLVELIDEGRADGSVPGSVRARDSSWRLAAVADGLDSIVYLGLLDRAAARHVLDSAVSQELGA